MVHDFFEALSARHDGTGFAEIKVALRISLQIHRELVKVLGDFGVVVEIFVEVGFAIPGDVVQARDLIASHHVNIIVDDL
jgi:hypothetical protein